MIVSQVSDRWYRRLRGKKIIGVADLIIFQLAFNFCCTHKHVGVRDWEKDKNIVVLIFKLLSGKNRWRTTLRNMRLMKRIRKRCCPIEVYTRLKFKVYLSWIFFLLIWKAFWNTEEWRFSFWNIFFFISEILTFFYYAN